MKCNQELAFHPYANYFPMMQDAEFASLVEDLKRSGLREKIWLFQDMILDGRNRYLACLEADIEPQFRQFTGSEQDALSAVLSWNLERRHLNSGQRAMVALEILPELERLAKEKQLATLAKNAEYGSQGGRGNKKPFVVNLPQRVSPEPNTDLTFVAPKSRDKAAQVVGTSPSSVQTAKKIATSRPDLAEKVKTGEISLHKAKQEMRQVEQPEVEPETIDIEWEEQEEARPTKDDDDHEMTSDDKYTPEYLWEPIIESLGGIVGLDPTANPRKNFPATHHLTAKDDCFKTDWKPFLQKRASAFMNPPYSNTTPFLKEWCKYLESGDLQIGLTLTLAGVLSNKTVRPLLKKYAQAIVYTNGRINFVHGGNSNDRDVVFIFWGEEIILEACEHFANQIEGWMVVPY